MANLWPPGFVKHFKPFHMRKQLLAMLIIATLLSACNSFVRKVNDVKQPKTESPQSVNSWLKSKGLDKYEVVTIDPRKFFEASAFYLKRKLIFNPDGKVAELGTNYTGVVCHFRTPDEVRNLKPDYEVFTDYVIEHYRKITTEKDRKTKQSVEIFDTTYYNLDSLSQYAYSLDGKKANIQKDVDADYFAVIPFAKFQGNTIQLTDIRKFLKAIEDNKYSTFKVVLLNLDKQAWWGDEWNKKLNFITKRQ